MTHLNRLIEVDSVKE